MALSEEKIPDHADMIIRTFIAGANAYYQSICTTLDIRDDDFDNSIDAIKTGEGKLKSRDKIIAARKMKETMDKICDPLIILSQIDPTNEDKFVLKFLDNPMSSHIAEYLNEVDMILHQPSGIKERAKSIVENRLVPKEVNRENLKTILKKIVKRSDIDKEQRSTRTDILSRITKAAAAAATAAAAADEASENGGDDIVPPAVAATGGGEGLGESPSAPAVPHPAAPAGGGGTERAGPPAVASKGEGTAVRKAAAKGGGGGGSGPAAAEAGGGGPPAPTVSSAAEAGGGGPPAPTVSSADAAGGGGQPAATGDGGTEGAGEGTATGPPAAAPTGSEGGGSGPAAHTRKAEQNQIPEEELTEKIKNKKKEISRLKVEITELEDKTSLKGKSLRKRVIASMEYWKNRQTQGITNDISGKKSKIIDLENELRRLKEQAKHQQPVTEIQAFTKESQAKSKLNKRRRKKAYSKLKNLRNKAYSKLKKLRKKVAPQSKTSKCALLLSWAYSKLKRRPPNPKADSQKDTSEPKL